MKKTILTTIILIISTAYNSAQDVNWQQMNQIEQEATSFTIDKLGNIYFISDDILTKHSQLNEKYSKKTYTNQKYGSLASVDVSNPFQILLFYKEYQALIILDNNLSLVSEISLYTIGIEDANIVCSSSKGGFWIFDNTNQNFQYFATNLQKTKESLSIDLMFHEKYTPIFMLEQNNQLYVNTSEKNILTFDQFANFIKLIPISIQNNFTVNETINYFSTVKSKLFSYNPISFETKEIDFSFKKNTIDARIEQKKLYIFTPKGVSVFKK